MLSSNRIKELGTDDDVGIARSPSSSQFPIEDDSSSSTVVEEDDYYSSMLYLQSSLSVTTLGVSGDMDHDELWNQNLLAEDFLTNISLTGAPQTKSNNYVPRFVEVSANDFLCNINLTGPMHLPRRNSPHTGHRARRHAKSPAKHLRGRHRTTDGSPMKEHNKHAHRRSPLTQHRQTKHLASGRKHHALTSSRDAQEQHLTNNIKPLRLSLEDDPDADVNITVSTPIHINGVESVHVDEDCSLLSAPSPHTIDQTSLRFGSLLSSESLDTASTVVKPHSPNNASASTEQSGEGMHRRALSSDNAAAAALRRTTDTLLPPAKADDPASKHRDVRRSRRLAASVPHDASSLFDTTHQSVAADAAARGRLRNLKNDVHESEDSSSNVFTLVPHNNARRSPLSSVRRSPRVALRRLSIDSFGKVCSERHSSQRVLFAAPRAKTESTAMARAPPSMMILSSIVPFVSRRRQASVVSTTTTVSTTARKKHNKKTERSFGEFLFPAWIDEPHEHARPPMLTTGDEDQSAIPTKYDATYLDDPALSTGTHRTVMQLPGLTCSVVPFVRPDRLKAELNERFRARHPWLSSDVRLTRLRKVKRRLLDITLKLDLEISTTALACLLLDKLIYKKFCQSKTDLKVAAAACFMLASKFNDPRYLDQDSKKFMFAIKQGLGVEPKQVRTAEFNAWIVLEFSLFVPLAEVSPHFHRLSAEVAVLHDTYLIAQNSKQAPVRTKIAKKGLVSAIAKTIDIR